MCPPAAQAEDWGCEEALQDQPGEAHEAQTLLGFSQPTLHRAYRLRIHQLCVAGKIHMSRLGCTMWNCQSKQRRRILVNCFHTTTLAKRTSHSFVLVGQLKTWAHVSCSWMSSYGNQCRSTLTPFHKGKLRAWRSTSGSALRRQVSTGWTWFRIPWSLIWMKARPELQTTQGVQESLTNMPHMLLLGLEV